MASVIAVIACVVALAAFVQARRAARQVAQLTDMYWQLKYEHGELKATLVPPGQPPPAPSSAFVPIGAVKRTSS
jgi:hypothetical protein